MKLHLCPVCQQHYFEDGFDICPICNWTYDICQEEYQDAKGWGNSMSLNEAREAFKQGIEIY